MNKHLSDLIYLLESQFAIAYQRLQDLKWCMDDLVKIVNELESEKKEQIAVQKANNY